MIVCTNCNHSNPEGAMQCESCYQVLPTWIKCPSCGDSVKSDAVFCGSCGHNLAPDPRATQTQESNIAENKTIESAKTPSSGTRLQVQNPILLHLQTQLEIELTADSPLIYIGKPNDRFPPDIDVTAFSDSDIVSRVHAAIHVQGDKYYVEDLGSSNGTYLNHALLPPKTRHLLKSGDRISLGKGDRVTFIFQVFLV